MLSNMETTENQSKDDIEFQDSISGLWAFHLHAQPASVHMIDVLFKPDGNMRPEFKL